MYSSLTVPYPGAIAAITHIRIYTSIREEIPSIVIELKRSVIRLVMAPYLNGSFCIIIAMNQHRGRTIPPVTQHIVTRRYECLGFGRGLRSTLTICTHI